MRRLSQQTQVKIAAIMTMLAIVLGVVALVVLSTNERRQVMLDYEERGAQRAYTELAGED